MAGVTAAGYSKPIWIYAVYQDSADSAVSRRFEACYGAGFRKKDVDVIEIRGIMFI